MTLSKFGEDWSTNKKVMSILLSITQKHFTKAFHKKHYMTTKSISKVYENFNTFFSRMVFINVPDFVSAMWKYEFWISCHDDDILYHYYIYSIPIHTKSRSTARYFHPLIPKYQCICTVTI